MIIVRLSGGMGNQMFQYALGRRLSIDSNEELKLDTTFLLQRISMPQLLRPHFVFRNYDLDVFNIHAETASPSDMKWWQKPIGSGKVSLVMDAILRKIPILPGWEKNYSFDEKILTMKGGAYLSGFWQSPLYFSSIRDVLLQDFSLRNALSEKSETLRNEMVKKSSVCIHVRRSDIAHKNFHGAMGKSYYDVALKYIALKDSVEKLYVFSDDIEWCKEHMKFDIETTYVGNEYAGEKGEGHMELMKACKHFVIPNSTFSWWAAWLSNSECKIVVAPKKWFNGNINTDDLIPDSWIRF
jgi:hypothetical protein